MACASGRFVIAFSGEIYNIATCVPGSIPPFRKARPACPGAVIPTPKPCLPAPRTESWRKSSCGPAACSSSPCETGSFARAEPRSRPRRREAAVLRSGGSRLRGCFRGQGVLGHGKRATKHRSSIGWTDDALRRDSGVLLDLQGHLEARAWAHCLSLGLEQIREASAPPSRPYWRASTLAHDYVLRYEACVSDTRGCWCAAFLPRTGRSSAADLRRADRRVSVGWYRFVDRGRADAGRSAEKRR